jgi:hypothetical protein
LFWVFLLHQTTGRIAMLLEPAQVWDLHDFLSDRNFTLYDEDEKETFTRWQHGPSGSVLKVVNEMTMADALTLAASAHAAYIAYPK